MARRFPVIVCIDVEPDEMGAVSRVAGPWRGYEVAHGFFRGIRRALTEATGHPAHFCWFVRMDPHIEVLHGSCGWAADRYGEQFAAVIGEGDEVGLHTHLYRVDPESGACRIDTGDAEWAGNCARASFANYRAAFGRSAESHRFGDRFMSNDAMRLVESLGCRHDLTLEPGFVESAGSETGRRVTGALADMRGVPDRPYHPSADAFNEPDRTGSVSLWAIPLSMGLVRPNPLKVFAAALLFTLQLGLAPRLFRAIADRVLASGGGHLAAVLKTDMLLDARLAANMRRNLEFLASPGRRAGLVFATPAEALQIMECIR